MTADAELGVMLEPTNDLEDEVGDVQASVGPAGGGGATPAQQDEQQSIISGGVGDALAAAGVLGAILSQLKSVTGIVSAVLGFFSRLLLPAVEVIAEVIRPLISTINDFVADPVGTVTQGGQGLQTQAQQNPGLALGAIANPVTGGASGGLGNFADEIGLTDQISVLGQELINGLNIGGPSTADQTGEQTKQQLGQNIDDALRDIAGAFSP